MIWVLWVCDLSHVYSNDWDNEAKGYVITPFPNMIGYVPLR